MRARARPRLLPFEVKLPVLVKHIAERVADQLQGADRNFLSALDFQARGRLRPGWN